MAWRDRFRRGEWGVGGDLRFVSEGEAEGQRVARVVIAGVRTDTAAAAAAQQGSKGRQPEQSAVPTEKLTAAQLGAQAKVKQAIANVPLDWTPEQPVPELDGAPLKPALLKMNGTKTGIRGPGIEIVSGTNGREVLVKTREGLWEHKRGRKVDGGERRKDEVRAKRRIAANKER